MSETIGKANGIAQIAAEISPYEPFLRYGLLGLVVGWILLRLETRLDGISHKIIGLNRTLLIDLIARESVSVAGKAMARQELEKLNSPRK